MAEFTPLLDLNARVKELIASEEEPPPDIPGAAFLIPPLVDVFLGNTAYVWYRLLQFTVDCSLEIERYDGISIGEVPEWFEEYDDTSTVWYHLDNGSYGSDYRGFNFALTEGIAPGQPFLVQFGAPNWYKCGGEVEEWDVDYDISIVRVMPRDPAKAAESIHRAVQRKRRYDAWKARYDARLRAVQRKDVKAMFFERSVYFVGDSYRDEMAVPTGCQVALWTKHAALPPRKAFFNRAQLLSARDDDSWEGAFAKLYARIETELGFTKEQLKDLPVRWGH